MASYVEFSSTVSRDEIMPAYKQLLTDINYCINLFEDLESGRTYWESLTDWTVGERNSINFTRMNFRLKKLKEEVEKGIGCYTRLFIKMKGAKMIEQSYQQRIALIEQSGHDKSQLVEYHNKFKGEMKNFSDNLTKAVAKVTDTGVLRVPEDIRCGAGALTVVGGVTGVLGAGATGGLIATGTAVTLMPLAAVASTAGVAVGLIGSFAYSYVHSEGQSRGLKYHELKHLSDALHNDEILSIFQTHHYSVSNISQEIDNTMDMCKKHFEICSSCPPIEISATSTRSSATVDDVIKATRIYDRVLRENIQMFQSDPEMAEMSGALKKRMATKVAETACRTFLMEVLNYSEREANECIRKIQN